MMSANSSGAIKPSNEVANSGAKPFSGSARRSARLISQFITKIRRGKNRIFVLLRGDFVANATNDNYNPRIFSRRQKHDKSASLPFCHTISCPRPRRLLLSIVRRRLTKTHRERRWIFGFADRFSWHMGRVYKYKRHFVIHKWLLPNFTIHARLNKRGTFLPKWPYCEVIVGEGTKWTRY